MSSVWPLQGWTTVETENWRATQIFVRLLDKTVVCTDGASDDASDAPSHCSNGFSEVLCVSGRSLVGSLTQVVMPLEENRAMLSSKSIPPTPMTSIWSAGLFNVLGKDREIISATHPTRFSPLVT